jgi:hypothetical protein
MIRRIHNPSDQPAVAKAKAEQVVRLAEIMAKPIYNPTKKKSKRKDFDNPYRVYS